MTFHHLPQHRFSRRTEKGERQKKWRRNMEKNTHRGTEGWGPASISTRDPVENLKNEKLKTSPTFPTTSFLSLLPLGSPSWAS